MVIAGINRATEAYISLNAAQIAESIRNAKLQRAYNNGREIRERAAIEETTVTFVKAIDYRSPLDNKIGRNLDVRV